MPGCQNQRPDPRGDGGCHAGVAQRVSSQLGAAFLVVGTRCYVHGVMKPDCCFDLVTVSGQDSTAVELT